MSTLSRQLGTGGSSICGPFISRRSTRRDLPPAVASDRGTSACGPAPGLTMGERWEYVDKNVARQVDPPSGPRCRIRPLTADEVRRLLLASADRRFEAAIYVAVLTELRRAEIAASHWSDVELGEYCVVQVRGSLQRIAGRLTIVESKTRESVRDVALWELGAAALRRHRLRQNAERLRLGVLWQDNDLIFPNVWGRPMTPDYFVRGSFAKLLLAAQLPRLRFHDLRHTVPHCGCRVISL